MMNNRAHLPAGQQVQGGADMGPAPTGGPVPGPRRGGRPQQHYPPAHHYHHHQHVAQPMYAANNYMAPYGGTHYYVPQPYQNAAIPNPAAYMPNPYAGYGRSSPSMQHFAPLQQSYGRPPQHSPIVSSPYQPPLPQASAIIPPLPHTPSSTHSYAVPPPMTPPVQQLQDIVPPPVPVQLPHQLAPQYEPQLVAQPKPQPEVHLPKPPSEPPVKASSAVSSTPPREPFRAPLPWLSVPNTVFPLRSARLRRRRKLLAADAEGLELPHEQHAQSTDTASKTQTDIIAETKQDQAPVEVKQQVLDAAPKPENKTGTLPPRSETTSTQDQSSKDATSISSTAPSSVPPPKPSAAAAAPAAPANPGKPVARSTVPAVPVVPALPKANPKDAKAPSGADASSAETKPAATPGDVQAEPQTAPEEVNGTAEVKTAEAAPPAPAWSKPKMWAGLFSKPGSAVATSAPATAPAAQPNGNAADESSVAPGAGSFAKANASSVAEALQAYRPGAPDKLLFLEPRGLVNTGNMCYMNSVLQVLIFCVPFYDFLDQVGKKAAHSFKSETPLVDAMIMFMREFKMIDSAPSVDQLKKRLKSQEYEQYGEPFTPEFVYEAIRTLPRFASMRRGHQQDAQEFLGFLLEGLHDECSQVMGAAPVSTASAAQSSSLPSPTSSTANDAFETEDDWLEVGPRQRSAVTRSSGHSHTLSPITKIFGGQLRSELRVPGNKTSVTLEPYQPLQLDIGSPEIRNIIDALKGLTRPEVLHGDFNSPHGKDVRATKQVFIESVPPVLVLHLKRFQFDAEGYGGTVKIWKKVGYPLEFEFPREVLSRQKRNTILADGSGGPRYRLIGVVYHHGKNASGGHYTVDVRRQDGREWIRIDDTVIRRVRDEDVAEGGAEEDVVKTGAADGRKEPATANRFVGMNDEDAGDDGDWKQAAGGKKWSSVVNGGATTPTSTTTNGQKPAAKQHKESMKENKVAYLLFYQRI